MIHTYDTSALEMLVGGWLIVSVAAHLYVGNEYMRLKKRERILCNTVCNSFYCKVVITKH